MNNYTKLLFPYAYNILGSSEDAEDVVQDILVKYLSIHKEQIKNERGFLIKSVINQSINVKKRKKTISTSSIWLPEPISTESADSNIKKEEILSYSILVLLEKLSAKERAVFMLKEAFDYAHQEIAQVISSTPEGSRKLLSRAKNKLANYKKVKNKPAYKDKSHLETYIEVMKNGDVDALQKLLSKEIQLAADGGQKVKVVRTLTTGITNTSQLILQVYKAFLSEAELRISYINHQPAILYFKNGILFNCQVFEIEKGKINSIYSIVDPDKLKSLSCK